MSSYFVKKSECSQHAIFPGVNIFTMAGEQMMASLVEFESGAIVEWHSHPHEQMGMLIEGRLHFFIGDQEQVLEPGEMWRIPGGVRHRAVAVGGPVKALDFFHPIRQDYL
ncbi:MAG: cupin domain-containing protein [Planctomycetales bacterium]|nr:cupin domain-containing protein [Planctomycetales bacterium]